ncbi:hypothetical protein E2C01_040262 [Portunus trituberculatus]|uniref:Uncharacterized protein n=1 Tax=Portunus trituberculatus TaxID=210409 RepID=A0A5B7FJ83_PORTR|nr:hypothetical protein [Portunus trituberculatus]
MRPVPLKTRQVNWSKNKSQRVVLDHVYSRAHHVAAAPGYAVQKRLQPPYRREAFRQQYTRLPDHDPPKALPRGRGAWHRGLGTHRELPQNIPATQQTHHRDNGSTKSISEHLNTRVTPSLTSRFQEKPPTGDILMSWIRTHITTSIGSRRAPSDKAGATDTRVITRDQVISRASQQHPSQTDSGEMKQTDLDALLKLQEI